MKFAVMGAGAVGCYYGGMLARAGHRVTLIGRPVHVQAMTLHGLRMQTLHFDETVQVQQGLGAGDDFAAPADADDPAGKARGANRLWRLPPSAILAWPPRVDRRRLQRDRRRYRARVRPPRQAAGAHRAPARSPDLRRPGVGEEPG